MIWLTDALVLFGVLLTVLSVYGMLWMPDVYTRLHAASKGAFVGVLVLLAATWTTGDPKIVGRSLLVAVFLILTNPVSAHAIGRAAFLGREKMEQPDTVDESGRL
jgi:multicomponent Na+:H+ antiporter subunit G